MIDVLVVDDDFRVAEINATYVAKVPGFRVAARAHSAAQALRQLQRAARSTWSCSTTTCPTGPASTLVQQHAAARPPAPT